MVVVNIRDEQERAAAEDFLAGLERLRKDDVVFRDVVGLRGNKLPITAVIADLSNQRARLEELVRYCARPAIANDRLTRRADGHYLLRLKTPYRDGTSHLVFEPLELMERLAAQIPKPRVNLVLYAGILAPHAKRPALGVAHARPEPHPEREPAAPQSHLERDSWAQMMRATFGLDVLACLRCGGRLRLIATILNPRVASTILQYLGRASRAPPQAPARRPPPFWGATDHCA